MSLFAFPDLRLISIDGELGQLVATLAADLGLRGADATYVAVAQQFDVPLLTWDREQASRASKVIRVQTPTA